MGGGNLNNPTDGGSVSRLHIEEAELLSETETT